MYSKEVKVELLGRVLWVRVNTSEQEAELCRVVDDLRVCVDRHRERYKHKVHDEMVIVLMVLLEQVSKRYEIEKELECHEKELEEHISSIRSNVQACFNLLEGN